MTNFLAMKIFQYLTLLVIVIILTGCPCEDYSIGIAVKNESSNEIVIACGFEKHEKIYKISNDTILNSSSAHYTFHIVAPQQVENVVGVFEEEYQDTITLFFIDRVIYDNTSWDSIANNYLINSRYDIPVKYYIDNFSFENPLPYPLEDDIGEIHIWK